MHEEEEIKESEKPIDIDFEQELYKHFGQIKDFTLGMRIGKYFYNLCKEQMMKGAVDLGTADLYWEAEGDRAFPTFDPPVDDLLLPDIISLKFEDGQKVRIIIVKEEGEE